MKTWLAFTFLLFASANGAHHEMTDLGPAVGNFFDLGDRKPSSSQQNVQNPTPVQQPMMMMMPNVQNTRPVQQPMMMANVQNTRPVQQPMPVHNMVMANNVPNMRPQMQPQQQTSQCMIRGQTKTHNGKTYWFSWENRPVAGQVQRTWMNARAFCINNCMDLATLESPQETTFVASNLQSDVYGVWIGARLCDEPVCANQDPIRVNGWVWKPTRKLMATQSSSRSAYQGWSQTGGYGHSQPDNLLQKEGHGTPEECVAILNDWYGDGPSGWHDIDCNEHLPFVCEKQ